ncbi:MAG: pre-peptidase C-terminal domain-containing protein [Cyanobacteria bacterium J06626_6]
MKFIQGKFQNKVTQGLVAAAVLTSVAGIAHKAALAQALLQQQGTLAPMEDAYTFDGEAGQTMTIELQSEDFDTILLLKGPDGEIITSNDDYGGTLNSTIVVELPTAGTYSAVASSFSGQGGNYQIEVRPASEYEQVFSRAYDLSVSEDFEDSIEAYTAAIQLDDTDPGAYLGRAEARINQAYISSTIDIGGPEDLPESVVDAVVEDYLKAADLLDQQGQSGPAASLREQAQYFTGEPSGPVDVPGVDSPEIAPEVETPGTETPEVETPGVGSPDAPIPVEPDGGIGDGAEPLPDAEQPAE